MYTNQTILNGIKRGDQQIINYFYKENVRYIQGYILRNQGNREDVEDVFQDAVVVLYQNLQKDQFEITSSLKTYFYGICKNIWRNKVKKQQRMVFEDTPYTLGRTSQPSIFAELENRDQEALYKKYFGRLSAENQNLLFLYFEGRSMREISELTGYSEGYARKKKYDVKKQLTQMIQEDPFYEELRLVC